MTDAAAPPPFDVAEADRLLMTSRAVRRRIDIERPVPDDVLFDCIDVAEQAPSGGNVASRRWLVIRDPATKRRLAELHAESGAFMTRIAERLEGTGHQQEKVFASSAHLVAHFDDAPALVIAGIWGRHDDSGRPGLFDSVLQAAWSFNLALRARGLGTAWTTMLNAREVELTEILGVPPGVTTVVTFPVGYTIGTDFRSVPRRPASEITYFERWGFTRQRPSIDGTARVAAGPGVVVEVDIEARPAAVWRLISDPATPARFATELVGAAWRTDAPHGVGSVFTGSNELGERAWDIDNHVLAFEENRVFEWGTVDPDDPGAVWRFEIEEVGMRSRLRFSVVIGERNNLTAPNALADPSDEGRVLGGRRKMMRTAMTNTIEGIKTLAESPTQG